MIFLPKNQRTQVNRFLGANKYTTFFNLQIIQIFLDIKISKVSRMTSLSKNVF